MKKKTVIGIVLAAVLLLIVVAAVFAVPKMTGIIEFLNSDILMQICFMDFCRRIFLQI